MSSCPHHRQASQSAISGMGVAAGGSSRGEGEGSGSKSDSQSDSYSEYLAAAEAERLDLQLAAQAEEKEAKEAEALARRGEGELRLREGKVGCTKRVVGHEGHEGHDHIGSHVCGEERGGVMTKEISAGSGDRSGKRGHSADGRRRRLGVIRGAGPLTAAVAAATDVATGRGASRQQEQPRIIFKEQWREKEARVWQEGIGDGHGFFYGQTGAGRGNGGAGRGLYPPKGWKLLPIIVKVKQRRDEHGECLA